MRPTFFQFSLPILGDVPFYAYSTLLILGFTVAIWLARREEDGTGRNGDRVVDLGILMLVFGVLGARLLSVLADGHFHDFVNLCTDPKQVPIPPSEPLAKYATCYVDADCGGHYLCDTARNACYPPRDCLAAVKFWEGGLAYYGGLLLAAPVGIWYAIRKKLGGLRIADLVSPMIALGLHFGRLGCFFNGCCYGSATDVPWHVSFPHGPRGVHPSQLYESAGALAIFALLYFFVRPRKTAHGQVFGALLVLYGLLRFVLEFFRADERGAAAGLSTSQWISMPLLALGAYFLLRPTHAQASRPAPQAG